MKTSKKTLGAVALGAGLLGTVGLMNGGTADASQIQTNNSVTTIKAEMHKQQGNKAHLAVYRVQKGDTLSGIAEASGLTMQKILEMNDIPNPNLIHIGQLINLGYGNQANNFVKQKGQSSVANAKKYTMPKSTQAQKSMNDTRKGLTTNSTTNYTNKVNYNNEKLQHSNVNYQQSQQVSGNVGTTVNTPNKPVYNGQQGQQVSGNTGTTVNVPNKPVNNGQQVSGNTGTTVNVPNKPSGNGGSTSGSAGTTVNVPNKPVTPNKPVNNKVNVNEVNKEYQKYISNQGWNGTWEKVNGYDKAPEGREGYAEMNAPTGGSSKWYAGKLGEATTEKNKGSWNDYKYGYSVVVNNGSGNSADLKAYYYLYNK